MGAFQLLKAAAMVYEIGMGHSKGTMCLKILAVNQSQVAQPRQTRVMKVSV